MCEPLATASSWRLAIGRAEGVQGLLGSKSVVTGLLEACHLLPQQETSMVGQGHFSVPPPGLSSVSKCWKMQPFWN